jgi:hypothetical protein
MEHFLQTVFAMVQISGKELFCLRLRRRKKTFSVFLSFYMFSCLSDFSSVCPSVSNLCSGLPDWANFRQWGGCFLWVVFFSKRISANLWTTFSQCMSYVLILTTNGLGYILGDFKKNSFGHPACVRLVVAFGKSSYFRDKATSQITRNNLPSKRFFSPFHFYLLQNFFARLP